MALNIKDPETDRLARELAAVAGESITVATRTALAERLVRLRTVSGRAAHRDELREIVAKGRAAARVEESANDEVLGYDEVGLPT